MFLSDIEAADLAREREELATQPEHELDLLSLLGGLAAKVGGANILKILGALHFGTH